MAFTSWASELARWKDAIANKKIESFFVMSTENRNEMSTTYTRLDNIQKFTDWLTQKASNEQLSPEDGYGSESTSILMSTGGG